MIGALRAGLIAAVLLAGAMAFAHMLTIPLMLTSWASSAALIAGFRSSPGARPMAVGLGHLISGGVGYVLLMARPQIGFDLLLLAPLGAGLAVIFMMLAKRYHPPAAANAVIPLFTSVVAQDFALAVASGALALAAIATALDRIDGAKS